MRVVALVATCSITLEWCLSTWPDNFRQVIDLFGYLPSVFARAQRVRVLGIIDRACVHTDRSTGRIPDSLQAPDQISLRSSYLEMSI